MPPPETNPYLVAAYVAGFFVLIPAIGLLWKGALFFAKAITKLDKIDGMADDLNTMKEEKSKESNSLEISLSIIEGDLNALQEKTGLEKRHYPDRRVGPADRRTA
jgi:hypothetical protein